MIHKLTNRKALQNSEWLAQLAATDWKLVGPPPSELIKVQQCDAVAHLNDGLIIQKINDAVQCITDSVEDPPSETQRVGSDGQLAIALHKAFDGLTAREASDPDFWAYVSSVGCPKYVRWRWNTQKPTALWTRFAGNIRRNAVSRLWWWAEITHDETLPVGNSDRYKITKNVQGRQSLMLWLIDCAFSGHPRIVEQLSRIQEGKSLNDSDQKKICRSVNRLARVVCLDALVSSTEAEVLCRRAFEVSQLLSA